MSDDGPVGRHDEIFRLRKDGSKAAVVNRPEDAQVPIWFAVPYRLDFDLVRDPGSPSSLEAVLFFEQPLKLFVGHGAIPSEMLQKDCSSLVCVHAARIPHRRAECSMA